MNGTLNETEYHPMAESALAYVRQSMSSLQFFTIKESIASTALSGNRLSEVLFETIRRLEEGEPVSDRYLLGLAWFLRDYAEQKMQDTETLSKS
jgi:hypothetical protein